MASLVILLRKMFGRMLNSIYNSEPINCTVPKKPIFISLPYLGKDSFILKRKLTSLVGRFYPQFKIISCFRPKLNYKFHV